MTVTVSIDDQFAEQTRKVAESMGMSLEKLILRYIEKLASQSEQPSAEEDLAALRRLSGQGGSRGWKFNRDEIHERR